MYTRGRLQTVLVLKLAVLAVLCFRVARGEDQRVRGIMKDELRESKREGKKRGQAFLKLYGDNMLGAITGRGFGSDTLAILGGMIDAVKLLFSNQIEAVNAAFDKQGISDAAAQEGLSELSHRSSEGTLTVPIGSANDNDGALFYISASSNGTKLDAEITLSINPLTTTEQEYGDWTRSTFGSSAQCIMQSAIDVQEEHTFLVSVQCTGCKESYTIGVTNFRYWVFDAGDRAVPLVGCWPGPFPCSDDESVVAF